MGLITPLRSDSGQVPDAVAPSINGLRAWNYDLSAVATRAAPDTQRRYYVKLAVPQTVVVTNIVVNIGATLTLAANNFAALYSVSGGTGTRVGVTADQVTAWAAGAGPITSALTGGPFTLQGGTGVFAYVGLLFTGGTLTNALYASLMPASVSNTGLTGASGSLYRVGYGGAGATDLPTSENLAGISNGGLAGLVPWVGLS